MFSAEKSYVHSGRGADTSRLFLLVGGDELSFKALAWAFDQPLKNPEKSVLIALAYRDNHDDPHGCYPSVPRIAKDCGLSTRSVQYCLRKLEKQKMIVVKKRRHRSTYYFMPSAWVVHDVHQGGVPRAPGVVHDVHPEPKDLTVMEPKTRVQHRNALSTFDEETEHRRKIDAMKLRIQKAEEVRRELKVGAGPEPMRSAIREAKGNLS